MKIVKWVILGIVLLVIVGGVALYLNLNRIIRSTVQTQSTQSLNLQTTLEGANLSLFGGKLTLEQLQIASPKGFDAPRMLTLDEAAVNVQYGQLRQDPIRISQITLRQPRLVIEQAGGKLNIKAAMDQMPPTQTEPMRLVIDQLQVADASVVFRPGVPGLANELTIPIPSITMSNIGTGEGSQNGAAINDVVMQVVTAMAAKAADSDKLPPELKTLLSLNVEQVAAQLKAELGKRLSETVQDLTKELPGELGKTLGKDPEQVLKDPGKAIEQGLGGLLKKEERKPTTR